MTHTSSAYSMYLILKQKHFSSGKVLGGGGGGGYPQPPRSAFPESMTF